MNYKITRRDFLNGVAIGAGASFLTPAELFAQGLAEAPGDYYPPTRTGIRGNHPGSFDAIHSLAWNGEKPAQHSKLEEHYDLVIVGAGVSGLAAARFFQKRRGLDAKILLLDNHDDFGGHAKRNEFQHNGQTLLGIGGSVNLESPESWSMISKGVLNDLGVDLEALGANITNDAVMNPAADSLLSFPGPGGHIKVRGKWTELMLGKGDYETAVDALPLEASERDKLKDLLGGKSDFLKGLSPSEKYSYIKTTSYVDFLTKRVGLSHETISIFNPFPVLMVGAATPRLSVMEAVSMGCPGLQGMGWLGNIAASLMSRLMSGFTSLYFPDGNASIARLLVHKLIPSVDPDAQGFEDIATSHFNYEALDSQQNTVRLRLNSTVVQVEEQEGGIVNVDYVRSGKALRVTADHCILACYNGAIPHICPQLPDDQKEALRYGVKVPLVMTNVLLDNGHAFSKLGATQMLCPNDPYVYVTTPPPTTTGGHQPPRGPNDPIVVYMLSAPIIEPKEGETIREILLRTRHQVYVTNFETYEREIRKQLQGLLGEHGFNHLTDIKAITVNRWPHGYSYDYFDLDDPEWADGEAPHEIGRRQFGRISIANADSEARAYLDAAIDAGWRAVAEQARRPIENE